MKSKAFAVITLLFSLVSFADTETAVVLDVARRNATLSLSVTEFCDHTFRAVVRRGGDDLTLAGYEINLIFGGNGKGCVYEGTITNVNEVVFHCSAYSLPTNGKYTVQIMSMKNRVSAEWGRGTLRVNVNPGIEYMPSCWMGYEKVARLSASMIALDLMTNQFWTAVTDGLSSKVTIAIPARTNQAVRVQKSFVDEITAPSYFVWDKSNVVDRVYRNAGFPGSYITMPSNGNFMAANFYLSGTNGVEVFNPCRINRRVWFRSTAVTNRKFMVKGCYCTDANFLKYLNGK